MRAGLRRWWQTRPPLQDPIERQQAPALQIFLITLAVAAALWMPLPFLTGANAVGLAVSLAAAWFVVLANLAGLLLLRRGQFRSAVLVSVTALTVAAASVLWVWGLHSATGLVIVFSISITMTGLLASWRSLVVTTVACASVVVAAAIAEALVPTAIGMAPLAGDPNILTAGTFVLASSVVTALLLQFGLSLRHLHQDALRREQELEQVRASLATTVANLHVAVQDVEQREAQLHQTLAELQASQAAIRDLSAPVVPVLPGVLIAPLVGQINDARASILMDNVLNAVDSRRATVVIFDITGVPVVDTHVAQALLRTAAAIRLLGARVVAVGIRPEVAQTLVTLGVALDSLVTYADLQAAIMDLVPRTHA
ncbi:MAG TPA: STAS domain-containing protein [Roseiflexaceae bacterium]